MKNHFPGIILLWLFYSASSTAQIAFPDLQSENANFNRPVAGQELDISPPGFCWWRAAPSGEVTYRIRIETEQGAVVYKKGLLLDPVHVPDIVFPAGDYRWYVDAMDPDGKVVTTRPDQKFSIIEGALELPWIDPKELLSRVPHEHPRLLFPAGQLDEIRTTLNGTRQKAFLDVKQLADDAMDLELMEKPDFDRFDRETEYPARRTSYRASYRAFNAYYHRGMIPLALMYQFTGEEKYGLAAKRHLLHVLDWELEGIASLESSFDEIGLRIARTAAQGYDWLYDVLTEKEREAVQQMLLARGDQMLDRLKERDFLFKSAYSHDGRLPGYLLEFSIVLAEEEKAIEWMDYAMQALLTVFPHWGGKDGGWAEGINYVLSYNDRFITPFQSLYTATGYDLWKKSYFRNMRHFIMYCVSPVGEITPFGDSEHNPVAGRAGDIYSILQFHSLQFRDPVTRWWIEQLDGGRGSTDRFGAMNRILLEDDLEPLAPASLPPDRAFEGVGWAALHSEILEPENDLMVLFKCSPYGPVSHSHADQNSFAILKGGKALANPSGARYPQHQSPFHFKYSNLTVAHNALLINGEGQIDRDGSANGRLTAFKSTPHLGYVAGDAQKCYGSRLDHYERHMIMIRPSVIIVIDDMSGSEPFSADWLMHGREEMLIDPDAQTIESFRQGESMLTRLFSTEGFDFSLDNEWPIDPKQDYPMVTAEPPPKEWHFKASVKNNLARQRIAAIMLVKEGDAYPDCDISVKGNMIHLSGIFDNDSWSGLIDLDSEGEAGAALLELEYQTGTGKKEHIYISGEANDTDSRSVWESFASNPGNHPNIPDCSYAGYEYGEESLPVIGDVELLDESSVINVKDFGALGNGIADDTKAVLSALGEIKPGGVLYFPGGNYLLTDMLRITRGNFTMLGEGSDNTKLLFKRSLSDILGVFRQENGNNRWAILGGLIWVAPEDIWGRNGKYLFMDPGQEGRDIGWINTKTLGTVPGEHEEGTSEILLSPVNGISPSDLIDTLLILSWNNDAENNLLIEIGGHPAFEKYPWKEATNLHEAFSWLVEAERAEVMTDGSWRLYLKQPLRIPIRPEWEVQCHMSAIKDKYDSPSYIEHFGMQGLTLKMPEHESFVHLQDEGYNGLYFQRSFNCWMYDVTINNPDNGIILGSSKNITLQKIRLTGNEQRHHGIYLRYHAHDCLLTGFEIGTLGYEALSINYRSSGNVFRDGVVYRGTLDSHRGMPFDHIRTNITLFRNTGNAGGNNLAGPRNGKRVVHWNIHVLNPLASENVFAPDDLSMGALIGIHGVGSSDKPAKGNSMPPGDKNVIIGDIGKVPAPPDLYLEQLKLRTGRITPSLFY